MGKTKQNRKQKPAQLWGQVVGSLCFKTGCEWSPLPCSVRVLLGWSPGFWGQRCLWHVPGLCLEWKKKIKKENFHSVICLPSEVLGRNPNAARTSPAGCCCPLARLGAVNGEQSTGTWLFQSHRAQMSALWGRKPPSLRGRSIRAASPRKSPRRRKK